LKLTARHLLGLALIAAGGGAAAMAWKHRALTAQDVAGERIHRVPRGRRPVLLLTLDTTRADHLAPYGARDVATPAIARLAEEGLLFERAQAVAPITLVAHTSIHTGLTPPQHGVRNNGLHYVPPQVTTLAERLKEEGFRTGAFVSAAVLERRYGLDQGFEVYDDDLSAGRERHPRMVADRPAEATVAAARAWLDGVREKEPFFLWVHLYDPHASYSPPPPYRDRYRRRLYDGEIAYMDAQIERLLAHPRLAADRALVMLVGDHGESLGEHGEQTHALLAYDSTLHVPWIVRLPQGPRAVRVPAAVSQVDLAPTLLDLLGLAPEGSVAGRSLVPLMEGRTRTVEPPHYAETYLPFYTYGWAKLRSLRRGPWKYVDAPAPELYDLSRDPRELSNLVGQEPGRAHDLRRDLEELLSAAGDAERETSLALDGDSAEKLRGLGYLAVGSPPSRTGPRPDPKQVIALHVGLEAARQLMRDRLFADAERRLEAVLEKDPENLAGLIDLAAVLQAQGRLEDALRAAERALSLDPRYPRSHLLMAEIEARRGRLEQSLKLVDLALGLDPRLREAQVQKTTVLVQAGRRADAAAVIRAALAQAPEDPRLNAVYASVVEMAEGDLEAADARLRAALARDPFLVMGWRLLGDARERADRAAAAEEAYREGLKREPDDGDLHARLGLLLARRGGDPSAEVHLREALRLRDVFRSDVHVALGAYLAEQGRVQEALEEYERVLAVQPGNRGARNNRAIAFYRTGRAEAAVAEWRKLAAEFPGDADVHNNLAAAALDRERWKEAEAHARRALAIAPGLAEAWSNLGIARDGQGRYAEAKDAFRKALAADPAYWQAGFNLAVTLRKEGSLREAADAFEELLQDQPANAEAHLELADLYAGPLHDGERARHHSNAFLRAAPSHPRAAEVKRRAGRLSPAVAE
jgi:arylsulfatase A-like enzyme/Tfp pilus assembly protein PilF